MTNEVALFNPAGALSAEMASVFNTDDLAGDLTDGAGGGGFQVISIRGSKWRVKAKSEEYPLVNADDEPAPSIEVVLLKANKGVSKLYYKDKYSEGDDAAPDCFSIDGITPDPSSTSKQHKDCATCKHNQWGSRITEAGKKAKVCADTRRMAVWLMSNTPDEIDDTEPLLLRVPAASLNDLQVYGSALTKKGYPYNALITRLGFDINASYPKLTFKAVRPINEEEADTVTRMFTGDTAANILNQVGETSTTSEEDTADEPPAQQLIVDTDFEQPPGKEPVKKKAAKKKAAKKQAAKPAAPEIVEVTSDVGGDELDNILDDLESLA